MKKQLAILVLASAWLLCQSQVNTANDPTGPVASQFSEDLPSRLSQITPGQSAFYNPQTTADMLFSTGEVFISKDHLGGGSLMLRGFSSNSILMEVDGIRMNTAISCSGNQQNVIAVDPFALTGADILFGPSSVLHGSDALGGVVSLKTIRPEFSTIGRTQVSGHAATRYSSAGNEFTEHADVIVGWKKWASATSITYSHFGDLKMGKSGPEEYARPDYVVTKDGEDILQANPNPLIQRPTGYSQVSLIQKVLYKPGENWDFQYSYYLTTTSEIPWYDQLLKQDQGAPVSAEAWYGPQTWMVNALNIGYSCTGSICDRMDIQVAHQYIRENRTERGFNDPTMHFRQESINAINVSFDMVKNLHRNHRLNYGIDVFFNDVASAGSDKNTDTGNEYAMPGCYPESQWGSYGLYLNYLGHLSDKISLQGGFRYNIYSLEARFDSLYFHLPVNTASINNDAMTGNLGAVYSPGAGWKLSACLSTGFRAPNADDAGMVSTTEPGMVIMPNSAMKAEYLYNVEGRIAKTFGDYFRADICFYYTFLKDALVKHTLVAGEKDSLPAYYGMSQLQTMENIANVNVYGIQAGVDARFPLGFGISARVNYQDGKGQVLNSYSYSLDHAAPVFGKAGVSYSTHRLRLELYSYFSGGVSHENLPAEELHRDYLYAPDENGQPYSPAWCTINIQALYQITGFLSVSAGAENLADARYRPYSWGITAPGRNFIISVRASF